MYIFFGIFLPFAICIIPLFAFCLDQLSNLTLNVSENFKKKHNHIWLLLTVISIQTILFIFFGVVRFYEEVSSRFDESRVQFCNQLVWRERIEGLANRRVLKQ